ncbi:8134_t:CDS:2 [Ambispora gerdemannii]|uniref:8134_t:CDS:1 n=1 Tax=Ambispora gerdemannii TaxID=144530 RepID=A0A9N9GQ06_9GLOM|nr:8134_t:CDS:2 [Ambispora gerdemannii]
MFTSHVDLECAYNILSLQKNSLSSNQSSFLDGNDFLQESNFLSLNNDFQESSFFALDDDVQECKNSNSNDQDSNNQDSNNQDSNNQDSNNQDINDQDSDDQDSHPNNDQESIDVQSNLSNDNSLIIEDFNMKQIPKSKDPILNDEKFAIPFGTTSNSCQIKSMFTAISAGIVMARKLVSASSSGILKIITKENTNNTNQH